MPDEPGRKVAREAELLGVLAESFDVAEVSTEVGGVRYDLLRPRSAEDLISEADFDRDERLPYWADLWPSAHRLAEEVSRMPGAGRRLLELGCGLGLVSAAALRAGWKVLATDYYEDALRFAEANAWRNAGTRLCTQLLDWRSLPRDLGRFDVVVASDVLYERPYANLVAGALARTLAPGGEGVIADPGRLAAGEFVSTCESLGLQVTREGPHEWREGDLVQRITILRLRWRGSAPGTSRTSGDRA